jgi:hypothetical protein
MAQTTTPETVILPAATDTVRKIFGEKCAEHTAVMVSRLIADMSERRRSKSFSA